MFVRFIRYVKGYLRIRVKGYSPERFINLCRNKQIYLWGLEPCTDSYEMYIYVKGFRKLKPILKKTGTKISIEERYGLPFFLHKHRKRKLFFISFAACLALIYGLSLFVWDVEVDGNQKITDETILEFLQTTNVYHGMAKRNIDCEQIVKDIRKNFNDIIWVSASVKGTRLFVQVKENSDTIRSETEVASPSNIVASKNGIIVKMITRKGVPQVKPGEEVKTGQLLVSGRVEVKDDSGEVVNYQYHNADADILAETTINYRDELPIKYTEKAYTSSKRTSVYLMLGTYRLTAGLQKNPYESSEIVTSEQQITLGDYFFLPIVYGKRTIREYKRKEKEYTKKELQQILSSNFEVYCRQLEEEGKQIIEKNVQIYIGEKSAVAKGTIKVWEDIGKEIALNIDF